ncbi:DUF2790 domain-containing protein [Pseudomonas sp. ADAK18]|jgi:hypothetical protein|uniref:DUF2790 domain-containing protein n=1 Tax=Pseudomonas sp. ADAK18 TaxID=2730848 RepID=UPI0014628BFB|nr:DUF2790 domain-containing protein [Pseudomonas sp. ADAK18]QJI29992.1 DUF2790 domain-containing protein [Pseudomonas sp. ADAK18]
MKSVHTLRLIAASLLMLGSAGSAFADTTTATSVIHDKASFFMNLDVDKVLASTDTYGQCGIVPAQLRYLDHKGQEHVLDYQVEAMGCTNDH